MMRKLMSVAVLGVIVTFSGSLQAESELLSDITSVNFYSYGNDVANWENETPTPGE